MPLKYRIDVLSRLKEQGFSTYELRKNRYLGESTIQKLRERRSISWENIESLCKLLNCQPNDFLIYEPEMVEGDE